MSKSRSRSNPKRKSVPAPAVPGGMPSGPDPAGKPAQLQEAAPAPQPTSPSLPPMATPLPAPPPPDRLEGQRGAYLGKPKTAGDKMLEAGLNPNTGQPLTPQELSMLTSLGLRNQPAPPPAARPPAMPDQQNPAPWSQPAATQELTKAPTMDIIPQFDEKNSLPPGVQISPELSPEEQIAFKKKVWTRYKSQLRGEAAHSELVQTAMPKSVTNDQGQIPWEMVLDAIADIMHEAWMAWSRELATSEEISEQRMARWQAFWVPFGQLRQVSRMPDQYWATRVLCRLFDVLNVQDMTNLQLAGIAVQAPPPTQMNIGSMTR